MLLNGFGDMMSEIIFDVSSRSWKYVSVDDLPKINRVNSLLSLCVTMIRKKKLPAGD